MSNYEEILENKIKELESKLDTFQRLKEIFRIKVSSSSAGGKKLIFCHLFITIIDNNNVQPNIKSNKNTFKLSNLELNDRGHLLFQLYDTKVDDNVCYFLDSELPHFKNKHTYFKSDLGLEQAIRMCLKKINMEFLLDEQSLKDTISKP